VSDEDLGLLLPGRSIDQFAADALAAGKLVVVTRGAEGAVGYTRQGRVTAPAGGRAGGRHRGRGRHLPGARC
jgi:fructokinase